MSKYVLPVSVFGTVVGCAVLLKNHMTGGRCPSKATINGKTVVITGANTGIGKATARELAQRGGRIIMGCRDMEKCEAAAKEIRGKTLNHHVYARRLDLASLKSIREFAEKIKQGHFLLTNLLLDKLKESAPSRVINLASLAHLVGKIDFEDLNWENKKFDTKRAYCPFFSMLVKSPELGAQPSVYLAVSEEMEGMTGRYYDVMTEKEPAPQALDEEAARRLWEISSRLVGLEEEGQSAKVDPLAEG
ncbi:Retinol dehydrogenase 13 [Collichthys lucidus]|uniref:Retinol dehydrogenase 13 n=1 Tax=Collichthys lucidus TaxID=240159 RepID=A0A4U5VN64_COLLU|nr:Retinol dehydrogenase 13 [Collichthys lucidus]